MKQRARVPLTFSVLAAGVAHIPAGSAWADHGVPAEDGSRAMEPHMRLMAAGNRGMAQMMDTPACMNMMQAPPFGG
ncbi:MAG: hypothetical protein GEV08_18405 [Acidimicrobiia bacterium]|nr:hypothetical protein [Acidimicrobiia bacterium]